MKLLIFKITGDEDYGALTFKQSGKELSDIHDEMLQKNCTTIEHSTDTDHWIVSLEHTLEINSEADADAILSLLSDITDDNWCGDYDNRKNTDWDNLLIEE